jgi:hypothetical protein
MLVAWATLGYGPPMGGKGDRPSLENRWWVDQGKDGQPIERPPAKFGHTFFRSAAGFQQDRAQRRLTDLNLKWFDEARPEPGAWAVLHVLERQRFPANRLERVRNAFTLPPNGRGVLVDSGDSVRVIITGDPVGERLVEVRLGAESSFDAWVHGEWVREALFRSFDEGLRRSPGLAREYLTTDRARPLA